MGYTPSFCTACYRTGRTGTDFMDVAKPGAIKYHCEPNALSTFTEYLEDYASPATAGFPRRNFTGKSPPAFTFATIVPVVPARRIEAERIQRRSQNTCTGLRARVRS